MHHLGLGIILLLNTNGALEPHDPRSSLPERDVHGFVLAIISTSTLTIAIDVVAAQVIAIATLVIATAVVLWDRDKSVSGTLTVKRTSIDRWERTMSGPIFH
jgi:hypothetical protein